MKPDRPFTPWPGGEEPPVSPDTMVEMQLRNGWETAPRAAGKFIWLDRRKTKAGGAGDVVGWRYPE